LRIRETCSSGIVFPFTSFVGLQSVRRGGAQPLKVFQSPGRLFSGDLPAVQLLEECSTLPLSVFRHGRAFWFGSLAKSEVRQKGVQSVSSGRIGHAQFEGRASDIAPVPEKHFEKMRLLR